MAHRAETPLQLLRPYWRLVLACFLGWFLDAFDQVALILVLPEIGKNFGVSLTAMGLVITAQSIGRIAGNLGWGWLADRYGRKLTFMLGVIWFAAFSGLSGLAWTYAALLVVQLFFGVGFGGEWTASAALLMESVPERARAMASSLMMAGYECGFFAAAGMQALLVPRFGWRSLFFVGIAPALLAIFIRVGIGESPVWLRTQAQGARTSSGKERPRFRMDAAAWQACAFMAVLQFQTASIYNFYPALLKVDRGYTADGIFAAIAAYSIGSVTGKLFAGWLASRVGERITIVALVAVTLIVIGPFASVSRSFPVIATAFSIGASSSGVFALVPHFLSQRFADIVRSFGMGLAYAIASFTQGVATFIVPATGSRLGLATSMIIFVIASSLALVGIVAAQPRVLPGRTGDADAVSSSCDGKA